jgi:hypothetical protein
MIRFNNLEHAFSEKPLPLFRGMLEPLPSRGRGISVATPAACEVAEEHSKKQASCLRFPSPLRGGGFFTKANDPHVTMRVVERIDATG